MAPAGLLDIARVTEADGQVPEGCCVLWGLGCQVATGLLAALELDKALYEAVYEAGNRPGWVGIPLRGLQRFLDAPAMA